MTAFELSAEFREGHVRYDFLGTLLAGWHAMRRHRRERRALVAISRLGPRLIRDMGFEPQQIYAALEGSWDEVDPAKLQRFLPRGGRI